MISLASLRHANGHQIWSRVIQQIHPTCWMTKIVYVNMTNFVGPTMLDVCRPDMLCRVEIVTPVRLHVWRLWPQMLIRRLWNYHQ